MKRASLFALVICGCVQAGCAWDVESRGSQSMTVDASKWGTGEQAITPTNSNRAQDGVPLDLRKGR